MKEYFNVQRIEYEGAASKNPFAFKFYDPERVVLGKKMKEHLPFAQMSPVEATYLAWVDLSAYEASCARIEEKCRRAGVALTSGTFFGPEGEGFMRVNFGCPAAQLTEGVKRLKAAMRQ